MKRLMPVLAVLVAFFAAPLAHAATKPVAAPAAVTDSLQLLERIVAKDSSKVDNLYRLGIMYLDREKNAEAAQVFGKANRLKPKNVKTLVNLGVAHDNLGKPELAQGFYQEAIAVAPLDSIASCRLATSYYAQGKFSDAMTLLRSLIAKQPRSHCASSRWACRSRTRVSIATPSGCGRRSWSWPRRRSRRRAPRRASTCSSDSSPGSDAQSERRSHDRDGLPRPQRIHSGPPRGR